MEEIHLILARNLKAIRREREIEFGKGFSIKRRE